MYILAGYKDASVSVQRAAPVANIKQGRGGPVCAGAPRENRGVYIYIHAYVCMYVYASEIRNTLDESLARANSRSRNSLPG